MFLEEIFRIFHPLKQLILTLRAWTQNWKFNCKWKNCIVNVHQWDTLSVLCTPFDKWQFKKAVMFHIIPESNVAL